MKLFLDNVGVVKSSTIQLDGLTVITGKNSSGKTTIGKTIYSLLSAGTNLKSAFEDSKKRYIISRLIKIERILQLRRLRFSTIITSNIEIDKKHEILIKLLNHEFMNFSLDKLIEFFLEINDILLTLTIDDYLNYVIDYRKNDLNDKSFSSIKENFENWKKQALEICTVTVKFIDDENAFYNFTKDRTKAFLNHEFNNQIKPVKYEEEFSTIKLYDNEFCIFNLLIENKNVFKFDEESSFAYPYDRCIYIDNPYVIDNLEKYNVLRHSLHGPYISDEDNSIISSKNIKNHDEILCELFLNDDVQNFFDYSELQFKLGETLEYINKIVPGEFSETPDGYFYVKDGTSLSVKNLATGSKMFFIIKKLLINGLIDERTMLILDEPESHLHPEWINKFAEILILIVKNIRVNVLLTTHSPNLLLALDVYSRKEKISNEAHFYLAEKLEDEYFSYIKNIDNNIGEAYSHLSLPLVEMDLESDGLNED